jgi:hypothetical protein
MVAERGGGLVEGDHAGLPGECAQDLDELPLGGREGGAEGGGVE